MSKFLRKSIIWTIVFLVLMTIIAELSLYLLRSSHFYKPSFVAQLEQKDFDYVVLGSSTGLTTIDTQLLDSLSGYEGVNLSMDDTALPTHYLMLQHFYNTGHTTKKVVLSITPWDLAEDTPEIGNNDYRFIPYINREYVHGHLDELTSELWNPLTASRFFPFVGLSYYNTELLPPSLISIVAPEKRNRFDEKGNYSYPKSIYKPKDGEPQVYDLQFNNPFLGKLEQFCSEKGIELILYQSPIYNGSYKEQIKGDHLINHISLLDSTEYFYDRIHVNQKGRKLVTSNLANRLF
ncbi:MAG: hypothetical protein WBG46_12110 [Nonlabens sp.]